MSPDGRGDSARTAPPAPPCTLVIFGASGDLTRRLLVPALYNLSRWGLLPDGFAILGVGRTAMSAAALGADLRDAMEGFIAERGAAAAASALNETAWSRIVDRLDYVAGDVGEPETYAEIGRRIAARPDGADNALFYLAVAASLFGPIVKRIGESGLAREEGGAWRRVIVEKPFGHDLDSARTLNRDILSCLREDQVFRIDHFLGKETVQNILAFRFGNGFFEPMWNRDRIDHVQITVAETVGVGTRGVFYDATGAMRDMVPNHLVQLFALIAMDPPVSFAADAVRDKKEEVLAAVRSLDREAALRDTVRAQYTAGEAGGTAVADYRREPDVGRDSSTETYVALKLAIDTWRWAGVPFYLRTGKAMACRDTEIAIRFKSAPLALFRESGTDEQIPNWLVLQLQPDEGIGLEFGAKVPGPKVVLDRVTMGFKYKDHFQVDPSTGYETLIYDAMIGDATLFQRADGIEGGWRMVQPVLDAWAGDAGAAAAAPMAHYAAGSAGPAEADDLLARDGRAWRVLG